MLRSGALRREGGAPALTAVQVTTGVVSHLLWLQYLMSPACLSGSSEEQVQSPREGDMLKGVGGGGEEGGSPSWARPTERLWIPRYPTCMVHSTARSSTLTLYLITLHLTQILPGDLNIPVKSRCLVQDCFPTVTNKAHKLRPCPRGQKCHKLIT